MHLLSQISDTVSHFQWHWKNQEIAIAYETLGQGSPVLLLPALSTVSTRAELAAIAQILAQSFQVTVVDWPGFGDSDRPKLGYGPTLYHQFLQDFIAQTFSTPIAIVAAGHSSGYALTIPTQYCSKLVLIAPTWKGPLAAMGISKSIRDGLKGLIQFPVIGQALYGLNTQPSFLKQMYQRHVVVDAEKLTPEFIATRHQNTQKPGARYAPATFVTGGFDPTTTREEFLCLVQDYDMPIMVIIGEQSPPKSKAEMEAIAALRKVKSVTLPGTLGMAEEFGAEIANIILSFFAELQ